MRTGRLLGPFRDSGRPPVSDGAKLIAKERERQVDVNGWTSNHDDTHDRGEMVGAAINYAELARFISVYNRTDGKRFYHGAPPQPATWPKDWTWKPDYADAIRNLVIAGALIAAEIDRLQRLVREHAPVLTRGGPEPPS